MGRISSQTWLNKGIRLSERFAYSDNQEDAQKALACFNRAIEVDPDNQEAWFEKAKFLFNTGQWIDAKYCAERAKSLDHTEADTIITGCVRAIGYQNRD